MDPVTICTIINAVAIVVLVIITWRYAHHTKQLVEETRLARRDDPELKAYLSEPPKEELTLRQITKPSSTFLIFSALLVNPGLVPIVIENITEEVKEQRKNKEVITCAREFQFALPTQIRHEQISIYLFTLPWIIPSDGFAISPRYLDQDINGDSKYELTIKFSYSVGGKPKALTAGPISLTPRHRESFEGVKLV